MGCYGNCDQLLSHRDKAEEICLMPGSFYIRDNVGYREKLKMDVCVCTYYQE